MKQILAPIISNEKFSSDIYLMWIYAPEIASKAQPGQFLMIQCKGCLLKRPLSIHRVRGQSDIALLYAIAGQGKKALSSLRTGEVIDILGPLGNGFSINPTSNNILLLAGGIGVAPLIFLTDVALKQQKSVTTLLGAATKTRIYYPQDFLSLEKTGLTVFTEDGSTGRKGLITNSISEFANHADQIFACGPIGMYQSIATIIQEIGYPKSVQVSLEVRMGCGIGACFGCSIHTNDGIKRVCKEGPIFELSEVMLDKVRL